MEETDYIHKKIEKRNKEIKELKIEISLNERYVREGKTRLFGQSYESLLKENKELLRRWQEKLKRCEEELTVKEKQYRKAA